MRFDVDRPELMTAPDWDRARRLAMIEGPGKTIKITHSARQGWGVMSEIGSDEVVLQLPLKDTVPVRSRPAGP